MIVFAAIVPHSPLLIPTIGKEHREKLALTLKAYAELEQSLYLAKPDAIVIISPHAQMYPDAFSGNISDAYVGSLKEFGDHGTTVSAKVDFKLLDHIHRAMRKENIAFTLSNSPDLDYSFAIPLLLLTPHLTDAHIVPLATSLLDAQRHYEFGRQLKQVLHAEDERIAVIASADLSHHANAMSPQGATPEGQAFDAAIREHVHAMNAPGLLALDPNIIEKAGQCGYRPIITLMGALEHMNGAMKELCYEAPFGVGYMTARFDIA